MEIEEAANKIVLQSSAIKKTLEHKDEAEL